MRPISAFTSTRFPHNVQAAGANGYFTGSFSNFGTSHTFFGVANVTAPPVNPSGLFAATIAGAQDTAFSLWFNIAPSIVGRTSKSNGMMNADSNIATSNYFGSVTIFATDTNAPQNTSNLYLNGQTIDSKALTFTPGVPTTYSVFARASPIGNTLVAAPVAYEFIVYNRQLSSAELTAVHRYLGGRYGISVP
jgi:hypothetical protein